MPHSAQGAGNMKKERKYKLAPGTQVREEVFGLLFYTMVGPRLYFLSSGELLDARFFEGELTLDQWIGRRYEGPSVPKSQTCKLKETLRQLQEKGVIRGH